MTDPTLTPLAAAFDAHARHYDRMVAANPGYHADLRRSAARLRLPGGGRGLRVLDAGCGTGASTAALLAAAPHAQIVACDFSAGMLAQARAKPWPASVTFVHADVGSLAAAAITGPFDAVFAAYLPRNLPDPDAGLRDLAGVLRPEGLLAVHEYSVRDSRRATWTWNAICWSIIIPLARVTGADTDLYRYLWRSVHQFDTLPQLTERLHRAGLTHVTTATMPGWRRGIVHTVLARRTDRTPAP